MPVARRAPPRSCAAFPACVPRSVAAAPPVPPRACGPCAAAVNTSLHCRRRTLGCACRRYYAALRRSPCVAHRTATARRATDTAVAVPLAVAPTRVAAAAPASSAVLPEQAPGCHCSSPAVPAESTPAPPRIGVPSRSAVGPSTACAVRTVAAAVPPLALSDWPPTVAGNVISASRATAQKRPELGRCRGCPTLWACPCPTWRRRLRDGGGEEAWISRGWFASCWQGGSRLPAITGSNA
eukprot:ctg_433.g280